MPAFQFQLRGFPLANHDAEIQLVNEASGQAITRKPFLDGSLLVRDLNAGFYNVKVIHPNLINPIFQNRVRLFPQNRPTHVPIPVPEDLFKDTPIRDIPDADLTPVQQSATGVRDQLEPIGNKVPGEVVKSADWNVLVSGVSDLANAVLELTHLITPRGHDHPEIAEKIAEVQGNVLRFSEAFARSLLELQRDIEKENLKKKVDRVLELGNATEDVRKRIGDRFKNLTESLQSDSLIYTRKLQSTSSELINEINIMASEQGDQADVFLNDDDVKGSLAIATHFFNAGPQTTAEQEFTAYRTTTTLTGAKFSSLIGG